MNEIKVITELCAEDRARLDRLTAALEKQAPIEVQMTEMPLDIMTGGNGIGLGTVAETKDHEDFVEIITEPEETEAPEEPTAPQHTKAELQPKVVSLVSAGKKEEVKEIIKQYAAKVSDIPEEKVDEVWDKLSKLEG